jgi:hypothetical protein
MEIMNDDENKGNKYYYKARYFFLAFTGTFVEDCISAWSSKASNLCIFVVFIPSSSDLFLFNEIEVYVGDGEDVADVEGESGGDATDKDDVIILI